MMNVLTKTDLLLHARYAVERSEAIHAQIEFTQEDEPLPLADELTIIQASNVWAIRAQAYATMALAVGEEGTIDGI